MRLGLSQERDFRNSLEGEKAFQDYLIASGGRGGGEIRHVRWKVQG